MDDMDLLRQYAQTNSQAAFSELVARHINWVYGVCRRRVGDATLADDVTQAVFIILAKKAGSFPPGTVLAGWLTNTARYASADALKLQARRRRHERKAAEMTRTTTIDDHHANFDDSPANDLLPFLDEALARLSPVDRDALALRFYGRQSLAGVAVALGVSEEAAKKRVSRGLDRLRAMLGGRAQMLSAGALTSTLLNATAQAAPPGLQAAAVAAATTGQAGTAMAIAQGTMKLMAWVKVKVAVAVVSAVVVGAGATAVAERVIHSAPASNAATAAQAPPVAPTQEKAAGSPEGENLFTLDGGPGFSRRLDRRLLQFTGTGGAFAQFHLVVPIAALPGRGDVQAEVVIERSGESTSMLVRSVRDKLPYACISGGTLVRLDPRSPGSVIVAEGVAPVAVVAASSAAGSAGATSGNTSGNTSGPMTEVRIAAGERKEIRVDLASLIEGLQRGATSRGFDEKTNAVKLGNAEAGGRVALVNGAVPGTPPVSEFNISEKPRLAVGVRDIRVDPRGGGMAQISAEMLELVGLTVYTIDRSAATGDLLPPAGFFDVAANREAAGKLGSVLSQRGNARGAGGELLR
ncbi:MAG: sigma-70 family RNA polymerase sigma factor [Planctomycetota bacterium]|nr:sigma-70 family RNA polymerase sigma factor [Planctomycetota bacterium]